MSFEYERDGKRWVLTAEHIEDNSDNHDADTTDLVIAGAVALKKYGELEEALRWLPVGTVVNYTEIDSFLEEVKAMGWVPGEKTDDDT